MFAWLWPNEGKKHSSKEFEIETNILFNKLDKSSLPTMSIDVKIDGTAMIKTGGRPILHFCVTFKSEAHAKRAIINYVNDLKKSKVVKTIKVKDEKIKIW